MADERLTDQTERTTRPDVLDLIHLVDVSNTTDHASGSSFKMNIANFLKGIGLLTIQGCFTIKASGNSSTSILEDGDFVIYASVANDSLIVGVIQDTISTVPDDLRVKAKCERFIDNSALL